jgi:hypothetical protein
VAEAVAKDSTFTDVIPENMMSWISQHHVDIKATIGNPPTSMSSAWRGIIEVMCRDDAPGPLIVKTAEILVQLESAVPADKDPFATGQLPKPQAADKLAQQFQQVKNAAAMRRELDNAVAAGDVQANVGKALVGVPVLPDFSGIHCLLMAMECTEFGLVGMAAGCVLGGLLG